MANDGEDMHVGAAVGTHERAGDLATATRVELLAAELEKAKVELGKRKISERAPVFGLVLQSSRLQRENDWVERQTARLEEEQELIDRTKRSMDRRKAKIDMRKTKLEHREASYKEANAEYTKTRQAMRDQINVVRGLQVEYDKVLEEQTIAEQKK